MKARIWGITRFALSAGLVVGMCLGLAPDTKAAQIAGVEIPETYQIDGQTLVLNGYALRTLTFLHIKIYVAGLYLSQRTNDPQAILASRAPKVVVVHYIHGGTKEQVEGRYREGEMENCGNGGCDKSLEADFERLVAAAPAVEPGDRTEFVVTEKGLRVSFNGRPLEHFGQWALGNLILTGFIGPHAPSPEFRGYLLGLLKP